MIACTCLICGGPFHEKASYALKRRTCGKACGRVWRSLKMSGQGNPQFGLTGDLNSSWKTGEILRGGYVYVYAPGHHSYRTSDEYVKRCRVVMEEKLGRKLEKDEHVHHLNEIKTDDRPENLVVVTRSEHRTIHNLEDPQPRSKKSGQFVSKKEMQK